MSHHTKHPGPVVKGKRNVSAKPSPPELKHPDCLYCASSKVHLDRQIVANGRLRLEVMDLKEEVKRYRKELYEHYAVSWVRKLLGGARCAHGVSMQGRCSYCGVVSDERI